MKIKKACWILCFAMIPLSARAAEPRPPEEFGKVTFLRDYDAAVKKAKADRKPLFVLFDEIPG
jgi:hypothetical protein